MTAKCLELWNDWLVIRWIVFCPDTTEIVDRASKTNGLPTYFSSLLSIFYVSNTSGQTCPRPMLLSELILLWSISTPACWQRKLGDHRRYWRCLLVPSCRMLCVTGKVHGSLARAGKVRGQTPKVNTVSSLLSVWRWWWWWFFVCLSCFCTSACTHSDSRECRLVVMPFFFGLQFCLSKWTLLIGISDWLIGWFEWVVRRGTKAFAIQQRYVQYVA